MTPLRTVASTNPSPNEMSSPADRNPVSSSIAASLTQLPTVFLIKMNRLDLIATRPGVESGSYGGNHKYGHEQGDAATLINVHRGWQAGSQEKHRSQAQRGADGGDSGDRHHD